MTRTLALLLAVTTLTGCSTISGAFKNELSIVPGTGELRFISFYGPVGIAAKIDSPAATASAPAIQLGGAK